MEGGKTRFKPPGGAGGGGCPRGKNDHILFITSRAAVSPFTVDFFGGVPDKRYRRRVMYDARRCNGSGKIAIFHNPPPPDRCCCGEPFSFTEEQKKKKNRF